MRRSFPKQIKGEIKIRLKGNKRTSLMQSLSDMRRRTVEIVKASGLSVKEKFKAIVMEKWKERNPGQCPRDLGHVSVRFTHTSPRALEPKVARVPGSYIPGITGEENRGMRKKEGGAGEENKEGEKGGKQGEERGRETLKETRRETIMELSRKTGRVTRNGNKEGSREGNKAENKEGNKEGNREGNREGNKEVKTKGNKERESMRETRRTTRATKKTTTTKAKDGQ